jgi:NADH:ubiquinone oxidoreductase subunit F (NADH-binding)
VASQRRPTAPQPRLLAALFPRQVTTLREHERRYGPVWLRGPSGCERPERLIDMVDAAGLTGRGGAGFPTGRKMRSVAGRGEAVVVANGAEGEPASAKDRLLLSQLPHLVLDGITLAAEAVGAMEAYLCVHRQEQALVAGLSAAVAERRAAGLDPVPIHVTGVPGRYVSSEQSSLVHFLNGGPAKPTFSPPRPHESGVQGRPTLVNNVETLAHIALIARYGDSWFRGAGVPWAPGTMLVTVGGAVEDPGVYEIELGTPAGEVIMRAGGPGEGLQALLIGGYFGAWLPIEAAWALPMTQATLRAAGAALGAGVVIALPDTCCVLAETARVIRYLAGEGARQCGPCRMGMPALAGAVTELAYHGGRGQAGAVQTLIGLVDGRGACRHPDGASQLARSALRGFPADAAWHDAYGPCGGVRRPPLLPLPVGEGTEGDWA